MLNNWRLPGGNSHSCFILSHYIFIIYFYEEPLESFDPVVDYIGLVGVIFKYLFITAFILLEETLLNRFRSCTNLSLQKMSTKSGGAWYKLRSGVSKIVLMEHHHLFLKSCLENRLMPHGLHTSVNIAFDLGPDILQSYVEDNASFVLYCLNKLIADRGEIYKNSWK